MRKLTRSDPDADVVTVGSPALELAQVSATADFLGKPLPVSVMRVPTGPAAGEAVRLGASAVAAVAAVAAAAAGDAPGASTTLNPIVIRSSRSVYSRPTPPGHAPPGPG